MGQLEKSKNHFILMAEAGFIAVNLADEDAAMKLFRASMLLNPENMLPKIGIGYLHLCKLELKQASKAFEEILAKEPDNDMAKTFLGLSYSLSPADSAKGEKHLAQAALETKDPAIKALAENTLEFVDTFVKKGQTSPADLHKVAPKKKKK